MGPAISSVDANDLISKAGCWSVSTTYAGGTPPSGTLKRSDKFTGTVPTHKWWTSALWDYPGATDTSTAKPFSLALYALPISARTQAAGLGLSYVNVATTTNDNSAFMSSLPAPPAVLDLIAGVAGMAASQSQVDASSDWSVAVVWPNTPLRATLTKGSPYAFFETGSSSAQVSVTGDAGNSPAVWANANGALGLTVGTRSYGVYAPLGQSWVVSDDSRTLTSTLGGKGYFSIAALPSATQETLNFFQNYAYNQITQTAVSWNYDVPSSTVTTTFSETVNAREPSLSQEPLMALFLHQSKYTSATGTNYSFSSPRGPMTIYVGHSITTQMPYHGVLPALPLVGADANRLTSLISAESFAPGAVAMGDTYGSGVSMNRYGELALLADAVGNSNSRDAALGLVRTALMDWFDASGDTQPLFAYDPNWTTLVGFPAGYGSDSQLNDHHFHWGYHIKMAALIGLYDSSFAQDQGYGGMVKALVRDCADPVRTDSYFPFLRQFDVYEGHSWASGHANFESGNNQESSSESMNFSSGLILWGELTGNKTLRDLGVYLYATEAEAIAQYWFNADQKVFPPVATHSAYAILWGDGATYGTWFTAAPEAISGIEYLPLTGGSMYLGAYPAALSAAYAGMVKQIGGPEGTSGLPGAWTDVNWEAQAFFDPASAITKFEAQAQTYEVEQGESRAHTYAWLYSMQGLGQIDPSVSANTSLYSVFVQSGVRTYVAYNASCSAPLSVRFSDGTQFVVPAHTLVAWRNQAVLKQTLLGSSACSTTPLSCSVKQTTFGKL